MTFQEEFFMQILGISNGNISSTYTSKYMYVYARRRIIYYMLTEKQVEPPCTRVKAETGDKALTS